MCTRQLANEILEKRLAEAAVGYNQAAGFRLETLKMIEDIFSEATADIAEKVACDPCTDWHIESANSARQSAPLSTAFAVRNLEVRGRRAEAKELNLATELTNKRVPSPFKALQKKKRFRNDDESRAADGVNSAASQEYISVLGNPGLKASLPSNGTMTRHEHIKRENTMLNSSNQSGSTEQDESEPDAPTKPGKLFVCNFDSCGKVRQLPSALRSHGLSLA
jgi:hypothetical protein